MNCYNNTLSSTLDRHAPLITRTVINRPTVPWFNDDVKSAKRSRRRAERKWRQTKLYCDLLQYKAKKNQATFTMNCARRDFYTDFIQENTIEQRELFRAAKTLFNKKTDLTFPDHRDSTALANDIGRFFVQKIERIRSELDATASPYPIDASRTAPTTARFDSFDMLSEEKVKQLISKSSKKSSSLDPMPTPLVIVSRRTSTCNYKAYKFVIRIWSVP